MPYLIQAGAATAQAVPVPLQFILDNAVAPGGVPRVVPFPMLPSPNFTVELREGEGESVRLNGQKIVVRVLPLLTCTAVFFIGPADGGERICHAFHAPSGVVSYEAFQLAMKEIGVDTSSPAGFKGVTVIYAHNRAAGHYHTNVDELERWIYNKGKVIEISGLPGISCAVNERFEFGQ